MSTISVNLLKTVKKIKIKLRRVKNSDCGFREARGLRAKSYQINSTDDESRRLNTDHRTRA